MIWCDQDKLAFLPLIIRPTPYDTADISSTALQLGVCIAWQWILFSQYSALATSAHHSLTACVPKGLRSAEPIHGFRRLTSRTTAGYFRSSTSGAGDMTRLHRQTQLLNSFHKIKCERITMWNKPRQLTKYTQKWKGNIGNVCICMEQAFNQHFTLFLFMLLSCI